MLKTITKLFGDKHQRDIKKLLPIVQEINKLYEEYHALSEEEMRGKTEQFKARIREERTAIEQEGEERGEDPEEITKQVKAREQEILDEILPEAYALVKETCRRMMGKSWTVCGQTITWDMIPYDVQLIGGIVLHQGKIAEMATGEGKTLVATMPLYLNALTGRGVHLVTVNDYLARRDREWMGPIYEFLGLTVAFVDYHAMTPAQKRAAYQADITYGTNNTFGFDYLGDNFSTFSMDDLVQRGFYYAIVDEVDFVLIDEARTPLIISGPVGESTHRYEEMRPLVERLIKKQTVLVNRLLADAQKLLEQGEEYEAGIRLLQASRGAPKNKRLMKMLQEEGIKKLISRVEADFLRDKRMGEIDEELYFSIDEKSHVVDLTEKGRELLSPDEQDLFLLPDLSEETQKITENELLSPEEKLERQEALDREYAIKSEKVHNVHQLLKAYSLFEKDVDYVVTDGRVMIVDEFTGRLMPGRRYSEGLHEALEAKERVTVQQETQTLATITLQNFFRMYDKLAGMTGTAETEAAEFYEIYKLDVVVIPTNRPVRRIDYDDLIYRTRREKYNAIIDEIIRLHEKNLPVLVGTISVEASETLSRMLRARGVRNHQVLNAKHHQREAEIVALAGQPGAVTIATNMAGRGTDIKLGPGVVKHTNCALMEEPGIEGGACPYVDTLNCRDDVPCGLHIIGTERHEARRIDRQLRGRSGRQGDPGASRFFISLEDDLMRLFGSERIATVMDKLGAQEGEVIEHSLVTRSIERAQKRVEARNFEIRKRLLEYDDVMNQQREVIYARRRHILEVEDLHEDVEEMIHDFTDRAVEAYTDTREDGEWDLEGLRRTILDTFLVDPPLDGLKPDEMKEKIKDLVRVSYQRREQLVGAEELRRFERMVLLSVIDERWKEHLYEMDQLKEGIGLRAYGQRDPLIEYKKEGFALFEGLLDTIDQEVLKVLFRTPIRAREEEMPVLRRRRRPARVSHRESTGMGFDLGIRMPAEDRDLSAMGPTMEEGDGEVAPRRKLQPVRVGPKVGRNDPCPCGSGKKYKKCCGRAA